MKTPHGERGTLLYRYSHYSGKFRGSLSDEPGANEPNILNDEPGNDEPFATVKNEWLQLPAVYKRVINKRLG